VWIVFGLGYLAVLVPLLLSPNLYAKNEVAAVLWLVFVAIAVAISLATIGARHGAPRGTKTAFASLLAIPLVLFLVFPGSCIYMFYSPTVFNLIPPQAPPMSEPAPSP
jgi:hypothetical protein